MDSHPMRRGSYKLLTKLVSTAETLKSTLRYFEVFNFVLDDMHGEIIREQDKAYLVIHDHEQPKRMFTYATFLILGTRTDVLVGRPANWFKYYYGTLC